MKRRHRPDLAPSTALLAAVLAALLSACGPGVGGTGTGAEFEPSSPSGALSPQALCASDLAPLLQCAGGALEGTQPAWWADGSAARDLQVRLEGQSAELVSACSGWQFSGRWSAAPGQAPRFHGTLVAAPGAAAQPASLAAVRQGTEVQLQLFDAAGQALGAPRLLQAVAGPLPARACS